MLKIGVIIPTFNRKELLLRAITSLQSQTFVHWEAYIVDDCSTDDIYSFLEKNKIFEDKRIHFTKLNKNSGVNIARNTALEKILNNENITYVSLLDDDDYFIETYFLAASNIIKEKKASWLVTACIDEKNHNITQIEESGEINYLDYLLGEKLQNDATMLIKKSLLKDIRFTTTYKNGYEWYFFLKLSTKTKMYVEDIPSKVVSYLETGLSRKKRKRDNRKKAFQKEAFKECSYNFYDFLAKKHKNSNNIKHYYYLLLSKLIKV